MQQQQTEELVEQQEAPETQQYLLLDSQFVAAVCISSIQHRQVLTLLVFHPLTWCHLIITQPPLFVSLLDSRSPFLVPLKSDPWICVSGLSCLWRNPRIPASLQLCNLNSAPHEVTNKGVYLVPVRPVAALEVEGARSVEHQREGVAGQSRSAARRVCPHHHSKTWVWLPDHIDRIPPRQRWKPAHWSNAVSVLISLIFSGGQEQINFKLTWTSQSASEKFTASSFNTSECLCFFIKKCSFRFLTTNLWLLSCRC